MPKDSSIFLQTSYVGARQGSGQALRPEQAMATDTGIMLGQTGMVDSIAREKLPLPITGLILCGGASQRMGRPKAFLPFGGRTMIEHMLSTVTEIFDEVFLVTNEPETFSHLSVNAVKDILPNRGPLCGLLSGLLVASNPYSFVLACDMPLINKKLLRQMSVMRHGQDVVVLSHKGGIEPLLGVYSKACVGPLEDYLFNGNSQISDFLKGLKATTYAYPEDNDSEDSLPTYFNVNTPKDYSEIVTKAGRNWHD